MTDLYVDTTELPDGKGYIAQQILQPLLGPIVSKDNTHVSKKCDVKVGIVCRRKDTGGYVVYNSLVEEENPMRIVKFFPLVRGESKSANVFIQTVSYVEAFLKEMFQTEALSRTAGALINKFRSEAVLCYRKDSTLYFGMSVDITGEEFNHLASTLKDTPVEIVEMSLEDLFSRVRSTPELFNWDTRLALLQL